MTICHGWRCRLTGLLALVAGVWTLDAWAAVGGEVSTEFLLGAILTVASALIAAYTRGVDTRVTRVESSLSGEIGKVATALGKAVEQAAEAQRAGDVALWNEARQLQAQIGLMRDNHPSRTETDQHRDFVEKTLARLELAHRESMQRLEDRIDRLVPIHHHRRQGDGIEG